MVLLCFGPAPLIFLVFLGFSMVFTSLALAVLCNHVSRPKKAKISCGPSGSTAMLSIVAQIFGFFGFFGFSQWFCYTLEQLLWFFFGFSMVFISLACAYIYWRGPCIALWFFIGCEARMTTHVYIVLVYCYTHIDTNDTTLVGWCQVPRTFEPTRMHMNDDTI